MCGIFGGISIKDPLESLQLMGRILRHRGPDDEGFFHEDAISLGHRRLSIIDLVSGQQPMFSADRQQVIVFNGEIYNFQEIRDILQKRGHPFRTKSDTEVILNAYREWGYGCLEKFNGMFAFALWDKTKRKLWLVRDRIGKKPLYMMSLGNSFYFASEAKALWNLPFFKGEYDLRAIDQYLTFRYVPSERTFYKKIKKISAGHWIVVNESGRIIQKKQWWQIPRDRDTTASSRRKSLLVYQEEFQSLFSSAVSLRLISDVPLGLFLSSGIDSASIAMEMAKVSQPTFITVGFGGETDEIDAATQLARELKGVQHVFTMTESDFDCLPDIVTTLDEPYGDAIVLPTYILARKAAEKVKVVLTGDGADEVLGGYIHHVFFRTMPDGINRITYQMLAALVHILPTPLLNLFFHYPAAMGVQGKRRLENLLNTYPDSLQTYLNFVSLFPKAGRTQLYSADFQREIEQEPDEFAVRMRDHFNRQDSSFFDKVLQWDMETWFPEQTLMKLDRLAMANSVEGRCPYADYRLVEFFLRSPWEVFKIITDNKSIIRAFYQKDRNYLAKKKKAFYLPLHKGYNVKFEELRNELLSPKEVAKSGWFRYEYISTLLKERNQSPLLIDKQMMSLVILFLWLKTKKKLS